MKNTFRIVLSFLIACIFFQANAQQIGNEEVCYNPNLVKDTSKKSLNSMAFAVIGGDSVNIRYHSPAVRKRIIWGGLVPYDEVWVTGAHDATTLQVNKPFTVRETNIPAGKYALFTIPGKKVWTIIINKNWQQHLATEYDQKDDVVRFNVKPRKNPHTERLQYYVQDKGNGKAVISIAWEKIKLEFDIHVSNL